MMLCTLAYKNYFFFLNFRKDITSASANSSNNNNISACRMPAFNATKESTDGRCEFNKSK
jgi:hypothetical protein